MYIGIYNKNNMINYIEREARNVLTKLIDIGKLGEIVLGGKSI